MARRLALLAVLALLPALALADDEAGGDEALEVQQLAGQCTRALVRGDDWTSRCAPMAVRATYRDGHQTILFFIEGAAELSFHVFKDYRKDAGLHLLLVDQLRLKKVRHLAPGYCLATGSFRDSSRLGFDRPVTLRCRAGTPGEADLADVTFETRPARR